MLLGIDHVVIAVADPEDAAARLELEVGVAATGGGRHEALGTMNRLVWFGDSYIELIGVFDRALAERSWLGAPTLRALEVGGGLATWAVATDSIGADRARLRATGSDLGNVIEGERRRADGEVVRWRLAAPDVLGPDEPPFLIEHDATSAEWTPADRAVRRAFPHPVGGPVRLEVLELPTADMNRSIQRLVRAAGLRFRPSLAGGGARDADVGPQIVRLVSGRTGSLPTVRLASPIPAECRAELFGCRWVTSPSPGS